MKTRALIAGLGSIGKRHLRLLRGELPDADIRALVHSGCAGRDLGGADGCFERLEDAAAFAPDIAIVASPAPFHLETAAALAKQGAHLLVEKPLSDRAEGIEALLALCVERGRILQVGYNLRFLETLRCFREAVNGGTIGDIHRVRCEIGQYLPDWRPGSDYRDAVSARRALGGGVLLELSHELDLLRWVFGKTGWVSAWTGRQSALEIDVEDCALITAGLVPAGGGSTVLQLGMDFLRRDATRTCTAVGAEGTLHWDGVKGLVDVYRPDAGWTNLMTAVPERDASYRAQIRAFLRAVESGIPDETAANGPDGLAMVRIIEAARASAARAGTRISVEA